MVPTASWWAGAARLLPILLAIAFTQIGAAASPPAGSLKSTLHEADRIARDKPEEALKLLETFLTGSAVQISEPQAAEVHAMAAFYASKGAI